VVEYGVVSSPILSPECGVNDQPCPFPRFACQESTCTDRSQLSTLYCHFQSNPHSKIIQHDVACPILLFYFVSRQFNSLALALPFVSGTAWMPQGFYHVPHTRRPKRVKLSSSYACAVPAGSLADCTRDPDLHSKSPNAGLHSPDAADPFFIKISATSAGS
jgi:hypothetical protein